MRSHGLKCGLLAIVIFGFPALSWAEAGPCFDFTKPVRRPLKAPPPFNQKAQSDLSHVGTTAKGIPYGELRAIVQVPILALYQKFLDPFTIKDPEKASATVESSPRPSFLEFRRVKVELKGIPIFTIDWVEEWAFELLAGTKSAPEKILISYQKVEGTSHLSHLCGSIVLHAQQGSKTDLFLYEEKQASVGEPKDIEASHLGTLRTLRGTPANSSVPSS